MQGETTSSSVRPAGSRLAFRIVIAVLAILLLTFLAFDFWFYRAARASLPQLQGSIRLAGLTAPVNVTFDSVGVPNISASNLADLFFAQGYITAQDRLWQMDTARRYASGDLAAVLGPEYVKVDREQRILGLRQLAEKAAAEMDPAEKGYFPSLRRRRECLHRSASENSAAGIPLPYIFSACLDGRGFVAGRHGNDGVSESRGL